MLCQGQHENLLDSSTPLKVGTTTKYVWIMRNLPSHLLWHLKTKGLRKALQFMLSKLLRRIGLKKRSNPNRSTDKGPQPCDEILNLKPGELVQVKSEEEILTTLDENRKNNGLLWMAGMRRFCGKRFRVYKRLERILLECTEEYRQVKNTVLLEGVICDGKEFHGCDRSCFHFWREVWLRRVEE
jgi:hypothetical protein